MRTHIDRDRGTFSEKEIVDQKLSVLADNNKNKKCRQIKKNSRSGAQRARRYTDKIWEYEEDEEHADT